MRVALLAAATPATVGALLLSTPEEAKNFTTVALPETPDGIVSDPQDTMDAAALVTCEDDDVPELKA